MQQEIYRQVPHKPVVNRSAATLAACRQVVCSAQATCKQAVSIRHCSKNSATGGSYAIGVSCGYDDLQAVVRF